MRGLRRSAACGALVLTLTAWLATAFAEVGPRQTLAANLAAGKPTVLIVSRTPTRADLRSEAYADWAGYLNDFAEEHRRDFQFVKIKPAELKAIFAEHTPIKEPFATVFFRNAQTAVSYDGMIHDRRTYGAAASFLSGTETAQPGLSPALKPFRFRLRGS